MQKCLTVRLVILALGLASSSGWADPSQPLETKPAIAGTIVGVVTNSAKSPVAGQR